MKNGTELYWALRYKRSKKWYMRACGGVPWISPVSEGIPPMPPPGTERVQVQLVVRKEKV